VWRLAWGKWRGQLSLAVLLAGILGHLAARHFGRNAAGVVGGLGAVLAGIFDSVDSGRISFHLLLLSRRVLQGVLGRPGQLRGWRATQNVPRRTLVPAHHSKCSPLFLL